MQAIECIDRSSHCDSITICQRTFGAERMQSHYDWIQAMYLLHNKQQGGYPVFPHGGHFVFRMSEQRVWIVEVS